MFSDEVKIARTQLSLSQQALAQELNVSFATINRWERGRTEPHPAIRTVFYKFCKKKGVKFNTEKTNG
ncbi:MAG: helix-turn-helix domain-containing protein [Clostridiales bacterium]|jgi:DNA-binding transcriptional regulator YiaG|nr:helix-turn-helix domain-containing protein [Clostridiales bacterium]